MSVLYVWKENLCPTVVQKQWMAEEFTPMCIRWSGGVIPNTFRYMELHYDFLSEKKDVQMDVFFVWEMLYKLIFCHIYKNKRNMQESIFTTNKRKECGELS